jgi:large conductance mechanosensitive channel
MEIRMAIPATIVTRPQWMTDFRDFIMRGSVVDLAVGIVIGVAFTGVINSLVKDIINPAIGLLTGGIDFSNYFIPLNGQHYANLEAARVAGAATLNVGLFVNSIINFLIISFAIFWIVKALTKLHVRKDAAPAGPTTAEMLLTEIRDELRVRPAV